MIFTCFAGRQRYLEILKPYIDKLLAKGLIDECHMWDYTRNESDAEWLKDNFTCIFHPKEKYNWHEYYHYYTSERYPDSSTVIIKCDDDIVYIDTDQFQTFIDNRRSDTKSLIGYAGIINNRHINTRQGEQLIIPFRNNDDINIMYDVKYCDEMHDYFTTNYRDVIDKARSRGSISYILPKSLVKIDNGHAITDVVNINFIAILAKDLWAFQEAATCDEGRLSTRTPYERGLLNYIDMSFTVVHMAFTCQRERGFDESVYLERYKEISLG